MYQSAACLNYYFARFNKLCDTLTHLSYMVRNKSTPTISLEIRYNHELYQLQCSFIDQGRQSFLWQTVSGSKIKTRALA